MMYSCFDQDTGTYKYFEDSKTIPVNGDLPVPNWLKGRTTKLGVPSLDAGRPLPKEAKPVGRGAQARGMVVQCNAGVGLSGGPSLDTHQLLFAGATMAVAGFLWYTDQKISSVTLGIVGAYSLIS